MSKKSSIAPKHSEIVSSWEIVFPNDTNPHGTMFGGKVMAIMDKIAAIAAGRYAERAVVTVSTEGIIFKRPIRVGDRLNILARVVWVGTSSMVVKVDVYAETPLTYERTHCTTARFNFVALDENSKPTAAPPLLLENDEEKREYELAEFVIKQALDRKRKIEENERGK
ncbi:MAG: acyl-CoA thioesterase [Calditrichaeota bacterium]|nr:acyl-CoA thioesterase [Calditrichota bacterium]MCB0266807.1 acyl-CoA thioesterase [Calditrichota bacterium]MCB0301737.1 acyl-CoA thioesterase [Calditrichota bacterium]MCB9066609.1 acyl-CoA thioesterase [Calditrichia bacterium]